MIEIPYELDFSEEELGEQSAHRGITPGFIRLSVGVECIDDILNDLERGLAAIGQKTNLHHFTNA